ncbi:hypothetical protein BD626DRAFT_567672 [Schizophyllum amplum]|uniref:Mannitol dehydrogenase N-terminal domain-containing protein n=1 Tax=Schizophyllum amplum TaxID=97359 RepID=A0A550CJ09_9AGAR|nr:hypothetical protein BD626DRAFT_567672 [Auriculariopsis ampla]
MSRQTTRIRPANPEDYANPAVLHFGADSVGRGFIRALRLANTGVRIIFADADEELVGKIGAMKGCGIQGDVDANGITGGSQDTGNWKMPKVASAAIHSHNAEALSDVATRDLVLITTSCGPAFMPEVASSIVTILSTRMRTGMTPLNIMAGSEDMPDATTQLRSHTMEILSVDPAAEGLKKYVEDNVGWANLAEEDTLDVSGDRREWKLEIDATSLKTTDPTVDLAALS